MAISPFRTSFAALAGALAGGGASNRKNVLQDAQNQQAEFQARFAQRQQDFGESFKTEGKLAEGLLAADTLLSDIVARENQSKNKAFEIGAGQAGQTFRAAGRNAADIERTSSTNLTAERRSKRDYSARMSETKRKAREDSIERAVSQTTDEGAKIALDVARQRDKFTADLRDMHATEQQVQQAVSEVFMPQAIEFVENEAKKRVEQIRANFDKQGITGGMSPGQYNQIYEDLRQTGLQSLLEPSMNQTVARGSRAKALGAGMGRTEAALYAQDQGLVFGGSGGGGSATGMAELDTKIRARLIEATEAARTVNQNATDAAVQNLAAVRSNNAAFFLDEKGEIKPELRNLDRMMLDEIEASFVGMDAILSKAAKGR